MSGGWFAIVSGNSSGPNAAMARTVLRALSVPYAAATGLRRWLYHKGVYRSRRAPIPVISVGNITVGGTGKTPFVEYLVEGLAKRGRTPAVVLRGYKAARGHSGDEASMLRTNIGRGACVIENSNRYSGCVQAAEEFSANVAVLDDGYQHLALQRDLDIAVLDATNPFGFGRLLPAGGLRERPEQLARADIVTITRSDMVPKEDLTALRDEALKLAPEAFVLQAVYETTELVGIDGSRRDPTFIRAKPIAAFCGIGNPYAFGITLRRLGAEVVLAKRFGDHHSFSKRDLVAVFQEATNRGAQMVLTTQKDAARIEPSLLKHFGSTPVYVLHGRFAIRQGERDFWELVSTALQTAERVRS